MFCGLLFSPFIKTNSIFSTSSVSIELDPINYNKFKYPIYLKQNIPINAGVSLNLSKACYIQLYSIHASKLGGSVFVGCNFDSFNTNFSNKSNIKQYNKFKDQPLSQISYKAETLGLHIKKYSLKNINGINVAYISFSNQKHRAEFELKKALEKIVIDESFNNIDEWVISININGLDTQTYYFDKTTTSYLRESKSTAMKSFIIKREAPIDFVYSVKDSFVNYFLHPFLDTFFSSNSGKFRYQAGLQFGINASTKNDIYCEAKLFVPILSTLNKIIDINFYGSTDLPNVASDILHYRNHKNPSIDVLFIQKSIKLIQDTFLRCSLGYYQVNYGGLTAEALWYPDESSVAFGIQSSVLLKRDFSGLKFNSYIRKIYNDQPIYYRYNYITQNFLNLYLNIKPISTILKASIGKFPAKDFGTKFEVTRYFANGLKLSGWISSTNAQKRSHKTYDYDKGIHLEIPLDSLFKSNTKNVWEYNSALWLKDAGYTINTGIPLFNIINQMRN